MISPASDLPSVSLVEGAFYWVRNRHGENPDAFYYQTLSEVGR